VLFPSTAAVALSLFTAPTGPNATWRSAVLAPAFGALVGMFAANVLEPGFLEVIIVVTVCMLGMRLMGVTVPAVLACAIVPLFAGPDFLTLQYPAAVLAAKFVLFVMFTLWRRTLPLAA
jgi:HPP family